MKLEGKKIFVTGTDTDVGKTFICALLMAGMEATYWKPIQSGAVQGTDTEYISQITGLPSDHFLPESYILDLPVSPHQAAAAQNILIDIQHCSHPSLPGGQSLIVEGAGGVMVPLAPQALVLDLMRMLDYPVLVVASTRLGTINHILLTLSCLRHVGLEVLGVVLNGEPNFETAQAIQSYGQVEVIQVPIIPDLKQINLAKLKRYYQQFFGEENEG